MVYRLPSAFAADALQNAFFDSRDGRAKPGKPGIDGCTAGEFKSNLAKNIADIRSDLRRDVFQFSRLRGVSIQKSNGGARLIAIPTVRDRLVQRAALCHLERDSHFPRPSKISFGFRKGQSLPDAQLRAAELRTAKHWAIKTDISQFFDRIDRDKVRGMLARTVRSPLVRRVLELSLETEIDSSLKGIRDLQKTLGIRKGTGLRQGMPVSPCLSNLALKAFDASLVDRGISAVRYADDIVAFFSNKAECYDGFDFIKDRLNHEGLTVPALASGGKSMICAPSETLPFLGVEIKRVGEGSYKIGAPFSKIDQVRARLGEVSTIEYAHRNKLTIHEIMKSIDAIVGGYDAAMAIAVNRDGFFERLSACRESAVQTLIKSVLTGKVASDLTVRQKQALGLESYN